jgi:LuxR family maltose regulon positive regulatory protein
MLSGRHDAEASLRELARRNAFVHPVRNRPGHHRVSPLLRDLLAAERDAMSMGSDDLHRTAADWYGAAEQLGPAVDQAIAAGDWDLAAAWAVRLMGLVDLLLSPSGGRLELAQRLRDMPARGGPDVQLVRAALALGEGDLDRAREHLAGVDPRRPRSDGDDLFGIRAGDDEASDDEATEDAAADDVAVDDGRLLWAAILGARLGELSGDVQATGDAAERARRSRWPGTRDSGEVQPVLTALLACSQGTAFLHAGELDRAAAALEDAVSAALAGGRDSLTLRCLSMLALAEACRGRLSHAQEVADTAEHVVEHIFEHAAGRVDGARREAARPAALDVAEAWVALERQDLQRAADALTRASRLSESVDPPLLQWVSLLLRARLKRDHGDSAAARHLLRDAGSQVGWLRRSFDDEAAAVGLLAAAAELEPGASVPAHVSESHEVEAMLETARIHGIRGDRRASRSTVAEALALARGERLRRPFAHAAPEVRAMLRTDRELRSQANWLRPDHMTASGERPRTTERALVVEELSERELEVLRHLSALLTTEEIASEMFISANTVRTHIRRILGKLSVSRRHEAVRRARELNLV